VSVASIWEISIKHALGKLVLPATPSVLIGTSAERFSTQFLSIQTEHALAAPRLPPHHKDPFDRMLVAQTLVEALTLVTADEAIRKYACPILWGI
jgi:PIN domain nuclease of toxin-antitoxin system